MAKKRLILWVCASTVSIFLLLLAANYLYLYLEERAYYWLGHDTVSTWPIAHNSSDPYWEDSTESDVSGDNKQWRVSIGYGPGASVRGWPSKGGYYVLYPCLTVEMDFLGLDRFKEAERPQNSSAADEEAHCKRMRQLGAKWWASREEESMWWLLNPEDHWSLDKPVVYFGWPAEGGVWALNTTLIGASDMGAGRVHMAITMEERCQTMEDLGAVYYANPEDCSLLDLSDEAMAGAQSEKITAGGTDPEREPQQMEDAEAEIETPDYDELRRQSSTSSDSDD